MPFTPVISVHASTKGFDELMKLVRDLEANPPSLRVGVFADKNGGGAVDESGISNVNKAAIHEFGAPEANIPERSFIRSTFVQHRDEYGAMLAKLMPRILAKVVSPEQAMNLIGMKAVADVNKKVRVEGVPPPLAPATIERKGSSRALIDTGSMLQSVTWVVLRRAAEVKA